MTKIKKNLNDPSPQLLEDILMKSGNSHKNSKYPSQEKALNFLFSDNICPDNDDMTQVILKVSCLNDFYSTNIFDTYSVAKHILSIKDFNKKLEIGDYKLVNKLAKVKFKSGRTINFYSFASKYCSHHKPDLFPIYDYYVEKMLREYNKKAKFMTYRKSDLLIYENFVSAIIQFQHHYNLKSFSMREIDSFLWQLGKKHYPKSYKKKDNTD